MNTISGLLDRRAADIGDRPAYIFVPDSATVGDRLTYSDLRAAVEGAATHIETIASAGDRAALIFEAGLDFIVTFFACLRVGVVPVPLYPPDPLRSEQSLSHLQRVVADCEPIAVFASEQILTFDYREASPILKRLLGGASNPARFRHGRCTDKSKPDDLALIQYTSGSTGSPKGVAMSNRNLLANLECASKAFGLQPGMSIASWLPLYHDMGLIGAVLQPLWLGSSLYLMSPRSFIRNPMKWLTIMSDFGVSASGGPNFAYSVCARRAKSLKHALNLGKLHICSNGAEPVHHADIEDFEEAFSNYGLRRGVVRPCYGLTEASLLVTGSSSHQPRDRLWLDGLEIAHRRVKPSSKSGAAKFVSCGFPPEGVRIEIVLNERICPDGTIGEIWVQGESVAVGYWGRPQETELTFKNKLAGQNGQWLRTGDLGFLNKGQLFVTGRTKAVLAGRGRKYKAEVIESMARNIECGTGALNAIALQSKTGDTILACETRILGPDAESFAKEIRKQVAAMRGLTIDRVLLVKPRTIALTLNGKLDRPNSLKKIEEDQGFVVFDSAETSRP